MRQSNILKGPIDYPRIIYSLERILAVSTAFVLPLSTAALVVFLPITVVFSLYFGGWRHRFWLLRENRMAFMFIVFYGLFVFGMAYTSSPWPTALHTLLQYNKFLLGFFLFDIFRKLKITSCVFTAFCVAGTITLLLSFIKFFGYLGFLRELASDSGVFKDHIFTGFLLAFMSYFYIIIFFMVNQRWRWIFLIFSLLSAYNVLFINLGRSGYVVLVSLFLLLAWQWFSWKGLFVALFLSFCVLGSVLIVSSNFKNRLALLPTEMNQYGHGELNTSTGLRLAFYKNSLKLILKHPWIGSGTGSFAYEYARIITLKKFATENPHNEYLNIAVQFGLLGLFVLFLLFYFHWRESLSLPFFQRAVAQAVLVSIAVGSLFNSWLMDVTQGYFYIFFTALVFSRLSSTKKV